MITRLLSLLGAPITSILSALGGPIAKELRAAYEARLNAENSEQRIAADIRIKELETEAALRRQKLTDPLLKTPLFLSEVFVSLYIVAIMADSIFASDWINPLELPEWFKPHFQIIVVSIFGISAADRFIRRK